MKNTENIELDFRCKNTTYPDFRVSIVIVDVTMHNQLIRRIHLGDTTRE